jgi:hypothetical protein
MSRRLRQFRWLAVTFLFTVLLGSLGAEPNPRTLRLLNTIALPPAHSIATDIRWISDDSVLVSWESDGVAEVTLAGAKRRVMVPDRLALNMLKHYDHLAISPRLLAVASFNGGIAWRPFAEKAGGKVRFQSRDVPIAIDFDLYGDKVLFLGLARHKRDNNPPAFAPQGDVAWLGTLSDGFEKLKPVLYDAGGPGAPNLYNCGTYPIGAVRFLADGSFVVAPGFQDGIHLFNAESREIRSWTNAQVGVDTHTLCSQMTEAEEVEFRKEGDFFQRWFNSHHGIDDILPLPQGPGLLVRSWGTDGQAHWMLKVLQPGSIATYAVPVTGSRPFDRLHGDVRNGRIVLLLSNSGYPYPKSPADLPAEVFLMELPKS